MNILKGRLTRTEISRFVGVEEKYLEKSLNRLADLGYLSYEKIKRGKYSFILFPEKVEVRELILTK